MAPAVRALEEKSSFNNVRKIDNVKALLMNHLENVEAMTEKAEDLLDSNIGDTLDSALEQDNDECSEMNLLVHSDFAFKDPTDIQNAEENKRRFKSIELVNDDTLEEMCNRLDEDQRVVFDIGVDYAKSIVKAKKI